jgi:hypothetical protein
MKACRSVLLVLPLLPVLAACAPARSQGPSPDTLLSEGAQGAGECAVMATPAALPAAMLLVDSASAASAIREYAATIEPAPVGHVLLSMSWDTAGLNYRRDVIEHGTTAAFADSIQRIIFAAVREVDGAELPWYLRLRVDVRGDQVALRVGRSELCPPVPRDAALESTLHTVTSAGVRYRAGRRERLIVVRVEVATGGQVIGTQIVRGPIMTTDQQRALADHVRQFSFRPATIDGRAVRGFIDIPVVLRG